MAGIGAAQAGVKSKIHPLRIALCTDSYVPIVSGLVTSVKEFASGLSERGHEVRIVCPEYSAEAMADVVDDHRIIRIPSFPAIVTPDRLSLPWKSPEFRKLLDEFDPDVVHVQTEFSLGRMTRRYCRSRGIPIVSTCHTYYEMYMGSYLPFLPEQPARALGRSFVKTAFMRDDFVVVPTIQIRKVLEAYGVYKDFWLIPSGVNEQHFKPEPAAAATFKHDLALRYPRVSAGPLLTYVGRIGFEKNLAALAASLQKVFMEFPDATMLMVGGGPQLADVQALFAEKGLSGRTIWAGFLPRESLPAVFSASDLFVFPSVTETQGLVTIEALLCGLPVVGINRMGTAELLAEEKGSLLSEDNAEEYAEKILRMLKNPALRATKAAEARAHGLKWSLTACIDMLEALYEEVVKYRGV